MLRNLIYFLITILPAVNSQAQQKKFAAYVGSQYTKTLYDVTRGNNPWGLGTSFTVTMQHGKIFEPLAEFNADLYAEDDKVLRLYEDESAIPEVVVMSSLLVGGVLHLGEAVTIGMQAGPGFVNRRVLLGLKPSIGLYFSETKSWQLNFFFTNFFNREKRTGEDFGSAGIALKKRIFRF